jgi:hypothetical protein
MFRVVVSAPGLESLIERLHRLRPENLDYGPLTDRIAEILIRGNTEARLQGIGPDGQPLAPISPETVERRRRAGKGDGPPLVPDLGSSRAAQLSAQRNDVAPDHVTVVGYWAAFEPILSYLARGNPARNLPPRPIGGITPQMRIEIEEALREWAQGLVNSV